MPKGFDLWYKTVAQWLMEYDSMPITQAYLAEQVMLPIHNDYYK